MPADRFALPPGIEWCGIGDEAAVALDRQLAALTELGWGLIEVRNVDGAALADLDDDAFDRLVQRLDAAGLGVACVDSRIANWGRPITSDFATDLRELEILTERCARLGTRRIRIMSYPQGGLEEGRWRSEVYARITELARRAESAGLTLLHENCAGWAGREAGRMLDLLAHVDSPALKLLFDTGNGVAYSYDSYRLLLDIAPHVEHVHIKDAVPEGSGAAYVMPGEGVCRVADSLRVLVDHGYRGVWSIEPHLNVRPHESVAATGSDYVKEFIAYGRALEELVSTRVLGDPRHEDEPRRSV
ncbi:sugar phosphate isomerase/epimerase family protein [Streptomyces sp. Go-475]|uniref:sugar phosphate isomerase/epimerase family protein n=1 Tax=Streptomyces sp. Go-475 TaxID=2072505 RepID=UPI000DEFE8BE|nr:sugar phosphate isomerase/epimerase family protein [Streptomyces sp. Go-475]AXE88766.1 fructoselysine 3-epimerase [Streptomyces sp. Go-475]